MRFALKPETFFSTRRGEAPSPTGRVAVSTSKLTYRLNTPSNDCIRTNFMNWKASFSKSIVFGYQSEVYQKCVSIWLTVGEFQVFDCY